MHIRGEVPPLRKCYRIGNGKDKHKETPRFSLCFDLNPKKQNHKKQKTSNTKFGHFKFCLFFAVFLRFVVIDDKHRCAHACVSRVKALPRLALAYMYLGLDPCHNGRRVCNKVLGEKGCTIPSEEQSHKMSIGYFTTDEDLPISHISIAASNSGAHGLLLR